MTKIPALLALLLLLIPASSFGNGGDQRVVDNRFFINLSRAPFTPRVGVKTSFLASFVDIQKNKLIAEDLTVRVRIGKQGEVAKGKPIFEQKKVIVHGGILELSYTFTESGLHEMFFDFAFASNPQKIYEVPDFLIDIQKVSESNIKNLWKIVTGFLGGFILGWFLRRRI